MANPLAWLGRRAAEARPAAVDVDITVLGRGLEHCTGVRITVNDTGATCPLRIIRQPQVQLPGGIKSACHDWTGRHSCGIPSLTIDP